MTARRGQLDLAQVPNAFQELRAEYIAGKQTRFQRTRTGLALIGSGADYHYKSEAQFLRMIEYARDMARNDTVVGAIVDRSVFNIFQDGFGFDPQTGDATIDEDLKASFAEWSTDPAQCDVGGRFTIADMAELIGRSVKIEGGMFVLPTKAGPLQLAEAHRCRTPSSTVRDVIHGVLVDQWRQPVEYWFTKDDIDPWKSVSKVSEMKRYPARDKDGAELVWHIYDPRRCTQTRGVTAFAPVFEMLGMFEDINFANLVKAQVAACFVMIRERAPDYRGGKRGQTGGQATEAMSDGDDALVEALAPGMEVEGRPGETIKGFAPNVPNTEYFEHAKFTLQLICACVNMPLISFLLDGKETNFSGWRGAIDQAKIGWKREQQLYARLFHRKAYVHHVRTRLSAEPALRTAFQRLDRRLFAVRINPPHWPYIQPIQDIEAARREREALLITPQIQAQKRGGDWEDNITQIVKANKFAIIEAIKAAQEILNDHRTQVDPSSLLYLDTKKPLVIGSAPAAATPSGGNGEGVPAALAKREKNLSG